MGKKVCSQDILEILKQQNLISIYNGIILNFIASFQLKQFENPEVTALPPATFHDSTNGNVPNNYSYHFLTLLNNSLVRLRIILKFLFSAFE